MSEIALSLPDAVIEHIAQRAAALAAQELGEQRSASPYLTVREAADRLRAKPQRIYDLLSQGRLTRLKDGRRVLVSREEIDVHLAGGRVAEVKGLPA
jgi:excisionase family DNA binding protein